MKRWLSILGALFIALNVVAFFHAWQLTHFYESGRHTDSPVKLSVLDKAVVLVRGVKIPRPECGPAPPDCRTVHFTTRDGVRLEAWDIPAETNRVVALLFHGHVGTKSVMLDEARMLRGLGARTVLVDFRGSGGSDGMTTTLGWRESADVAAATAWAREQWPDAPLVLYGTSMGAVAVLRAMAVENVRPDGIILECPFDRLLTTISHRYHAMGLPAFPFARLLVFWGGVQNGFNGFAHNPAEYARAVTCPALVVTGEDDLWVKPDELRRVASAMRGPTECRVLTKAGHGRYASEEYRQVLTAWVNQRTGTEK